METVSRAGDEYRWGRGKEGVVWLDKAVFGWFKGLVRILFTLQLEDSGFEAVETLGKISPDAEIVGKVK